MSSVIEQESNGRNLVRVEESSSSGAIAAFASPGNYEAARKMAVALANSTIIPDAYRGKPANCLVAMEIASRVRASVMMVMQNLYIVSGKPGWGSSFLIASVNSSGRFSPLRFQKRDGIEDPTNKKYAVRAVARELASGEVLEGEWITWDMVSAEKWDTKPGSKWKTMPGQMFIYRAAAFWTRTYCPEIALGMRTSDEIEDYTGTVHGQQSPASADLNKALQEMEAEVVSVERAAASDADDVTVEAPAVDPNFVCEACGVKGGKHANACPYTVD